MDFQKIDACAKGDRGYELALKMREKTDSANIEYVPWISVEGKTVDFHTDLTEYICENYLADKNVPGCNKKKQFLKFYLKNLFKKQNKTFL